MTLTEAAGTGIPKSTLVSGHLRLILGDYHIAIAPGEVAEFYSALPHRFGPAHDHEVEILSLLSLRSERIRVRATPRRKNGRE